MRNGHTLHVPTKRPLFFPPEIARDQYPLTNESGIYIPGYSHSCTLPNLVINLKKLKPDELSELSGNSQYYIIDPKNKDSLAIWAGIVGQGLATFSEGEISTKVELLEYLAKNKGFVFLLDNIESPSTTHALFFPPGSNTVGLYWGATASDRRGKGSFTKLFINVLIALSNIGVSYACFQNTFHSMKVSQRLGFKIQPVSLAFLKKDSNN